MDYLQRLKRAMLEKGTYEEAYIEQCLSYGETLLSRNLPVLFDQRHVYLVLHMDELRIPKQFKRKLRQEIHYCKKFGVSTHLQNTRGDAHVNFREYLYGKAYYIKMVEPGTGEAYLRQLDSIQW